MAYPLSVPLWMKILGSPWLGRVLVAAGLGVVALIAVREPPATWWHWPAWIVGACAPGLAVSSITARLIGRGTLRCSGCRKLTPYFPRPPRVQGMSEPHLRCVHCGDIQAGL